MKTKEFLFFLMGLFTMSSVSVMAQNQKGVIVPIRNRPVPLDPQNYDHIYSMVGIIQVHRGLLKFLPNLEITTDLAESYKIQDAGKKIVFKLKRTKFSNGEVVTALHVVRTFQRMFKNRTSFAQDINYIKNGDKILLGEAEFGKLGVKALNDSTVEFELSKPSGIILSHLATIDSAIIPVDTNLNYDWKTMGGAGAYLLQSMSEKSVILRARKGELPEGAPDSIEFREMSEPEAQQAALKGEVDSLDGFSTPKDIVDKLAGKGWKPSVSTLTRQLFLGLNANALSENVRKTIVAVINAKDFDLLSPSYRRGAGIIPFGLAGAFSPPTPEAINIVPLRKTVKLSFTIVDAEPLIPHLAKQIRDELALWNIKLDIKTVSIEEYIEAIRLNRYDIILRSKFLDYPDGYSILTYFRSNYEKNTFGVANKKIDILLDRALSEMDIGKRSNLYRKIQNLILEEHTVLPLVFGSNNLGMWSSKVSIVPAHPLGVQGLAFESLKLKK